MILRPVESSDELFLRDLYASTRERELAVLSWTREETQAFLAMQFNARQLQLGTQFPDAMDSIVAVDGARAGRLSVNRDEREIRVLDVALLPAFRGSGIGTRLFRDLIAEAAGSRRPLRLHVDRDNVALRFYEKLGFQRTAEAALYISMEWYRPTGSLRDGED